MRWIGTIGIVAAVAAPCASANDARAPCYGLLDENGEASDWFAHEKGPLLADNQCEALKSQELRLLLLAIPQKEEDPMALSFGAKNGGGALRFKIPFSFSSWWLQPFVRRSHALREGNFEATSGAATIVDRLPPY